MVDVTIIIPFLNEGREPLKTIDSILKTTNHRNYEFILVNDDPNDPVFIDELPDYKDKTNITLFKNPYRFGVGGSRNVGISNAKTPYVLIMDAHMRFTDNNWFDIMLNHAKQEDNVIFSALTSGVDDNDNLKKNYGYGCDILFKNRGDYKEPDDSILSPKWMKKNDSEIPYEVPCVMGACYMINRNWINHIRQFKGLKFWGSGEPCISLKSWLMGGKCKMIPEAKVGHIYRKGTLPYILYNWYKFYNKAYLIYTLFPENMVEDALRELSSGKHGHEYNNAMVEFLKNREQIDKDREEYQSLLKHDIKWYIKKFNYDSIYNFKN